MERLLLLLNKMAVWVKPQPPYTFIPADIGLASAEFCLIPIMARETVLIF